MSKVPESTIEHVKELKIKGLSLREISKELNIKFNTVRTCLSNAGMVIKCPDGFIPPHKKDVLFYVNNKGCHICTSHALSSGYPTFYREGRKVRIGRYLYIKKHGFILENLVLRHTCDDKLCINVDHLDVGTIADNNMDYYRRGINSNSYLNEHQVLAIFNSKFGCTTLARIYGVTKSTILNIKHKRSWKAILS